MTSNILCTIQTKIRERHLMETLLLRLNGQRWTYGRASERSHGPSRPVSLSAKTPLQGHFPREPPPLYSKCR